MQPLFSKTLFFSSSLKQERGTRKRWDYICFLFQSYLQFRDLQLRMLVNNLGIHSSVVNNLRSKPDYTMGKRLSNKSRSARQTNI